MSTMIPMPASPQAEASVIGQCMAKLDLVGDISGQTDLKGKQFHDSTFGLIWDSLVESYFADDPVDPVTIGARLAPKLGPAWGATEGEVVTRLQQIRAAAIPDGTHVQHARVLQEHAQKRQLLELAAKIQLDVQKGERNPEQIAGFIGSEAVKISTGTDPRHEIVSFADTGRAYIEHAHSSMAAAAAGVQVGVKTGINAMDDFAHGFQPGELIVCGGQAGVGKSGFWWRAGLNFARMQSLRPPDRQIGTLVLSMEMGAVPSGGRFAQMLTGMDTNKVRDGSIAPYEIQRLTEKWNTEKDLPLWLSYKQFPRMGTIRAIVAEAIRKHNVGFVIIDHFRTFRLDRNLRDANEIDEEKVTFLKYQLALEFNIVVVVLAHSRKLDDGNARPKLSDLRGSGMIGAHADFVNFLYRPILNASESEIDRGTVLATDAEILHEKTRFGEGGKADFYFDLKQMYAG